MGHVPHLLVEIAERETIELSSDQRRHLEKVLRYKDGSPLSYTDGRGVIGEGVWESGRLVRDEERQLPDRPIITIAVAPPKAKDRQRLVVEKLGELGVSRLVWLTTRFGQVSAPSPTRCEAWAVGALEQSRSGFLLRVETGSLDLLPDAVLADVSGGPLSESVATLAIGPEGGWHSDELAGRATARLSDQVLRTETAAIIGGALLLVPRVVT